MPLSSKLSDTQSSVFRKGNFSDVHISALGDKFLAVSKIPKGIAIAKKGCFLNAPDVYMDKIAAGGNLPKDIIDIDEDKVTIDFEKSDIKKLLINFIEKV